MKGIGSELSDEHHRLLRIIDTPMGKSQQELITLLHYESRQSKLAGLLHDLLEGGFVREKPWSADALLEEAEREPVYQITKSGEFYLEGHREKRPRNKIEVHQESLPGVKQVPKSIQERRGQEAFRQQLIRTYQRCLVTGCDAVDALEAAHVRPYSQEQSQELSNGLLLRADIHTLFDLDLLVIEPDRMKIILSSHLLETVYGKYHNKPLQFPLGTEGIVDRQLLRERFGRKG
jgi:hypothetical protein